MREGWTRTTLGEVAEIVMGQSPPGRTYNDRGEGMPFVQGAAEFGQQHPEPIKWCTEPRKVAAPGDLLVSVRAPVGALSIAAQRLAIGRGLAIVRGLDGIALTAFLRLALEAGVAELRSRAGGGMFESITRAGLSGLSLDKPPLAEQRRIIDLVGAADDVMARAGSELESLIDARRAMLRSLLAAREGWARTTLGEIAVEVRDRVANPARSGLDRYVGLEHFESDVPLPRHGHPSEVTSQKSVFRVDDVLFGTLRPYLRKVALAPWPGICSTDVLVVRSRPDQVLPQFLYYLMASDRVIARAVETSIGTRMPRTSFGALKDCVVVLPPLDEQRRIVDLMGSFDAAIMRAHELRRAAVECRSALLANLLSGKDTIAESYDELIGV